MKFRDFTHGFWYLLSCGIFGYGLVEMFFNPEKAIALALFGILALLLAWDASER